MTWEDELSKLDLERADGRLSEQQYRARRDDLLAEAAAAPALTPAQRRQLPLPPVSTAAPRPKRRQRTPARELLDTPRPTTAPSPADEQPTERLYPTQPTPRTVTVPVIEPEPLPPVVPQRIPAAGVCPPWERIRPARERPMWLLISAGVLLVLASVIGAMWWIGTAVNNEPRGISEGTSGLRGTAEPALIDQLPVLPGQPHPQSSAVSVARGAELGLFEAEVARALQQHRVGEVVWKGSTDGTTVYTVLVAETPDARTARALTGDLATLSEPFLTRFKVPGDRPGLLRFHQMSTESNSVRVLYAAGDRVVRIDGRQAPAGSVHTLRAAVDALVADVMRVLPPG